VSKLSVWLSSLAETATILYLVVDWFDMYCGWGRFCWYERLIFCDWFNWDEFERELALPVLRDDDAIFELVPTRVLLSSLTTALLFLVLLVVPAGLTVW